MYRALPFLLPLIHLVSSTFAQTSGTFDVLSFNVAGLPAILNDNSVPGDKTANIGRIGKLFADHAALYDNDDHPFRTATSGGVPFGSGLNSLSDFEWTGFERVKWETCSNIDGADCLTPKGFTFMRVRFSESVWIDAYNLHADAGTTAADLSSRASNLRQVSDYIKMYSTGNPVLVFGDSNSRYTRAADIPSIFSTENGMTDAWLQLIRSGVAPAAGTDALLCDNPSKNTTCETVDKVWYRGSSAVGLQATNFQYAGNMFLQENGDILSDHNPVLVDFAWTLRDA